MKLVFVHEKKFCDSKFILIWMIIPNFRVGEKEGFMTQSTIGQLASSASGWEK